MNTAIGTRPAAGAPTLLAAGSLLLACSGLAARAAGQQLLRNDDMAEDAGWQGINDGMDTVPGVGDRVSRALPRSPACHGQRPSVHFPRVTVALQCSGPEWGRRS